MEFRHTIIMKIILKLNDLCPSRSQLTKTVKSISVRPAVLSGGFEILVGEEVEKVEELH